MCVRPQIRWFPKRTHRTRHIVVLSMTMGSKKIQGKRHVGGTRHKLSESHGTCLLPSAMSCADTCEMSIREASELKTQGFCWGLVIHVGTLCLACTKMPDSRSWLVFSMNHTVYTKNLGRVGLFYQSVMGTCPKSKFPEAS